MSYSLDNEQQFWDELDDICSVQCETSEVIDQSLRMYLHFTSNFTDDYLASEEGIARCIGKLIQSQLFKANRDYVRTQLVYSLLEEDESRNVYIIASFLLLDGRHNEETFEMMNKEGSFVKLVDLVKSRRNQDSRLHRLLLELLYEMSRMQRLSLDDLAHVDDDFVMNQFQIIEEVSDDVNDPYHYPIIRVLLVLNEQYMVAATTSQNPRSAPLTNRVVKILSVCGDKYMTFGENIILLLNRETETSLQLLILKLLYLLFTTEATQDYFYTNDLRVLLDVIIRNLLDLPNELLSLRHTYLRVLYPLLAYTQLSDAPHYKREEITKVLSLLGGSANAHFAPADDTTIRLVERVAQVPWLREGQNMKPSCVSKTLLGISLSDHESGSSVSVVDLAGLTEKPGVQTPSRKANAALEASVKWTGKHGDDDGAPIVPITPQSANTGRPPPPAIPPARGCGHKKQPPKAPPRRRTRLKDSITLHSNIGGSNEMQ